MAAETSSSGRFGHLHLNKSGPLECALRGTALLNHAFFNKGSAFTRDEREHFQLHGLLPQGIQTLDQQADRAYQQYCSRTTDLAKNTFLSSLKDQNEVLYFRVRIRSGCAELRRLS
jgi:malate dehydrogenase (oxaloacetate-decarboxylating)